MIDPIWLEATLLAQPHTVKTHKDEWGADLYLIGEKFFAFWGGDKTGAPILTLKLDPAWGEILRREHPGEIIPGYYMNKIHWNSLYLSAKTVSEDTICEMIDMSYQLVLSGYSKKKQREILAG